MDYQNRDPSTCGVNGHKFDFRKSVRGRAGDYRTTTVKLGAVYLSELELEHSAIR